MKVAGRKTIVSTTIDFMTGLSFLVSWAILCEDFASDKLISLFHHPKIDNHPYL